MNGSRDSRQGTTLLKLLAGIAAAGALLAAATTPGQSTEYHWCASDGGIRTGGMSCYYETIEQCRAALSGGVGFCTPNHMDPEPQSATKTKKRR